jgi:hypothetical protein
MDYPDAAQTCENPPIAALGWAFDQPFDAAQCSKSTV